jgi:hypothetical protein
VSIVCGLMHYYAAFCGSASEMDGTRVEAASKVWHLTSGFGGGELPWLLLEQNVTEIRMALTSVAANFLMAAPRATGRQWTKHGQSGVTYRPGLSLRRSRGRAAPESARS